MRRPARARAAIAAVALAAMATPGRGTAAGPWYEPDHVKLQLAGDIGFVSPGIGYALARRFDGDVFFGWVPEAIGGTDIFSVTGKLTWAPWSVQSGQWSFRPFTAAFQVTYTFGDQYFVIPPEPFIPTALRGGFAFGSELGLRARTRTVAVYAEAVVLDLGLAYWVTNPETLGPTDVFSLAFGVRLAF